MATGKVFLIGAGPGDPELMTLKAARALGRAEVVLVDALVSRGCLAHVHYGARVIQVGKRNGCASTPQAFIEKMMIETAKSGRIVARLKGGDPFVFGRGGEELEALLRAGVEVEVIPGVTAGVGVPAALGIPVTHRDLARGVTFLTGHTKDRSEPDWRALVRSGTTLVVYMGFARMAHILSALQGAGMPGDAPACVVENGTLKTQRAVVGTIASLPGKVQADALRGPALMVIGAVVRLAQKERSVIGHSREAA